MGGNSGAIIVQNLINDFNDPLVLGKVPTYLRAHLDAIRAKDPGDCTHRDVRFMAHCLVEAHADC
jgi:hypothetical protein